MSASIGAVISGLGILPTGTMIVLGIFGVGYALKHLASAIETFRKE